MAPQFDSIPLRAFLLIPLSLSLYIATYAPIPCRTGMGSLLALGYKIRLLVGLLLPTQPVVTLALRPPNHPSTYLALFVYVFMNE